MAKTAPPPNPANPRVKVSTSEGDMVVELFEKEAPISVKNFLDYVDANFFSGLIFHRVIPGFVIQGGGHEPNMRQKATRAPIKLEINKELRHWNGALSMARTNVPNSGTSQFYVCHGAQHGLDDNYAVFGIVREGMDVVEKIAKTPTDRSDKPKKDILITGTKRM